jgi:hypothetical protein
MKKCLFYIATFAVLLMPGCKNVSETSDESQTEARTPVTVSAIEHTDISENIQLSATTGYLKKNQVKANVTGYIEKAFAVVGQYVQAGKPLFYIRTKEAEALSKFHAIDTSFAIKGLVVVKATESGIFTEVNKYANDYVNDGDAMATIAQQNSFVFLLNVPFELKKYASVGTSCNILLPDSTRLKGTVISQLSTVDPVSQTQSYEVKSTANLTLPENLVATVQLVRSTKKNTQVVNKSCVLSDETMENFWVMKIINDSTAVKVPVKKGLSDGNKIEIVTPVFNSTDRIISSGQYGLPDTANIIINK